ncbi:hypothetical protein ABIE89_008541 [Bradyrhizobium niftali]
MIFCVLSCMCGGTGQRESIIPVQRTMAPGSIHADSAAENAGSFSISHSRVEKPLA